MGYEPRFDAGDAYDPIEVNNLEDEAQALRDEIENKDDLLESKMQELEEDGKNLQRLTEENAELRSQVRCNTILYDMFQY
jgi:predicted  nucleic acid-binding Zn-ribbon protein